MRRLRFRAEHAVAAASALTLAGCSGGGHALVSLGSGIDGPAGARLSVYARGVPDVSAFAFDATGRLWAAASGATKHGRDGVFLVRAGRTPVKVATLSGPLGLVWIGDRLYVSTLAGVVELSGLHGTRFARQRTILRGPSPGENNNLLRAPNGRLVLGISAPCDHCTPASKWAGAIVSFRRDGGDLRLVARRIRAPFGLAYHDGVLYATLNQRDDLGAKTPGDVLVRVRQGDDRRFPACYDQGGAACAGVSKPVAFLDPHAAAGGIAFLGGVAYVAEWNRGKLLRVTLSGQVTPYLTGLRNPLPVAVRGGAVYVGDWGSGRIYRLEPPG